jgi:hypothetical protein
MQEPVTNTAPTIQEPVTNTVPTAPTLQEPTIPDPTMQKPVTNTVPTMQKPVSNTVPITEPATAPETMNLFKPANTITEPVKPIPQTLSPQPAPITLSPEQEKEKKNSIFETFNQFLNKK